MRLIHETDEDVAQAAEQLRKLGPAAIGVLREVVEHQEVPRNKASASARALESAGFISIDESDVFDDRSVTLRSRLSGEEALEYLEGNKFGS